MLAVLPSPFVRTAVSCPEHRLGAPFLEQLLESDSQELEVRIRPEVRHIGVGHREPAGGPDCPCLDRHMLAVAAFHRQVAAACPAAGIHILPFAESAAGLDIDRPAADHQEHCHQRRIHMLDQRMRASFLRRRLRQARVLTIAAGRIRHPERRAERLRGLARRPGMGWPWSIMHSLETVVVDVVLRSGGEDAGMDVEV